MAKAKRYRGTKAERAVWAKMESRPMRSRTLARLQAAGVVVADRRLIASLDTAA